MNVGCDKPGRIRGRVWQQSSCADSNRHSGSARIRDRHSCRLRYSEVALHTDCRTLLETFRVASVELIKIIRSIG